MIGFNAQMVQYFLNRKAHRRTAPPNSDNKTGPEPAFEDAQAQLKGIR
jgi:hypothetical protein